MNLINAQPIWNCQGKNNFNFLRVVFAIAVMFSHARPLLLGPYFLDPIGMLLSKQVDQRDDHPIDSGHLAVYGFYILSGFLITMSWCRGRAMWPFLRKRIARIYPGFFAAMLMTLLVFAPLGSINLPSYWAGLASHWVVWVFNTLNLTENWEMPPFSETLTTVPFPHVVNGSIWTIRYEFLCYLMAAGLGVAANVASRHISVWTMRVALVILFALVYGLYVGQFLGRFARWNRLDEHPLVHYVSGGIDQIPRLFVYFIAGMCCYAFRKHIRFNLTLVFGAGVSLLASAFVAGLLPFTLPILGTYLLLALAFIPAGKLSQFGTANDLSYGIYLYAFPVQQLIGFYCGAHLNHWTAFLTALPPTLGLAWLSWQWVEQPWLRGNKLSSRIAASQAVA